MVGNALTVKVRWSESDPAGIVYYPRFFEWFDLGTEALFESLGLPWAEMFRAERIVGVPIVESGARFASPVRYGDHVRIQTTVSEVHEKLTATGMVVGTPTYMSPEQASGDKELDGRSDTFALACVLYELLAGEPPFHGPTPQATLMRRFTGPPRNLRPVVQVPEHVEAALFRALARDPKERFATADEFAAALSGAPVPARAPDPKPAPAPAPAPATQGKKGCAATIVLAAALGTAIRLLLG